jgi:hypothetical protein
VAAVGIGCHDAPEAPPAPAPVACDPLATVALRITAGEVVAVGKDAAGTVYMVDRAPPSRDRLFVSRGMVLVRQPVWGSGESGSGTGSLLLLSGGEASAPFNLQIERGRSGPARMGLLRGDIPSSKFFTIGVDGEVLEVLPSGVVDNYRLQNLPGTFSIEHLGATADGRLIIVISPDVDTRYEDFRLFLGPPDHLLEHPIVRVSRGSYTRIAFTLDGREAIARFGSPLSPAVTDALLADGQSEPLTVPAVKSKPAGAIFFCTK